MLLSGCDPQTRKAVNRACAFLALRDFDSFSRQSLAACTGICRADVLLMPGCDLLSHLTLCREALTQNLCDTVVFSGGIGHSTPLLRQKAAALGIRGTARATEAEIMLCAAKRLGVDPGRVFLETRSSNSGENCSFTAELLLQKGIVPGTLLAIHDPLMQRRTDATLRRYFPRARILNFAPFVPRLDATGALLSPFRDQWPERRFLTLLLGELQRLCDDGTGYTPSGKNYIAEVRLPREYYFWFMQLKQSFPDCLGRI